MVLRSQPKKKETNKTRAAGAWRTASWMPNKYGRLFIRGKQKTKSKIPALFLKAVVRKTRIKMGTKTIWKDFTRGTYLV
jgi:hypothetical protein